MKLNNKFCYGVLALLQSKKNLKKLLEDVDKNIKAEDRPNYVQEPEYDWDVGDLINVDDKLKYVFSKPVLDTLTTIKIKDNFDCNILLNRKTKDGVIILNEKELFVFGYYGGKLRVLHLSMDNQDNLGVEIFSLDLINNKVIVGDYIEKSVFVKFVRCIVYLDFLPITTQNIVPGGRVGSYTQGKVKNETDSSFIFVSKAWNYEYETLPGVKYLSRAHWGIRWTGKGRTIPQLVFVKHSLKQMHKRATKEIILKRIYA